MDECKGRCCGVKIEDRRGKEKMSQKQKKREEAFKMWPMKVKLLNSFEALSVDSVDEDAEDAESETLEIGTSETRSKTLGIGTSGKEKVGSKTLGIGTSMMIGAVEEVGEEVGMVEVVLDSGANRSVWPRKRGGVTRKKLEGKVPNLCAANGTKIEVEGEALLKFKKGKKLMGMKFLDADVQKPLGAASAMVDAGNTVILSPSGSMV